MSLETKRSEFRSRTYCLCDPMIDRRQKMQKREVPHPTGAKHQLGNHKTAIKKEIYRVFSTFQPVGSAVVKIFDPTN